MTLSSLNPAQREWLLYYLQAAEANRRRGMSPDAAGRLAYEMADGAVRLDLVEHFELMAAVEEHNAQTVNV